MMDRYWSPVTMSAKRPVPTVDATSGVRPEIRRVSIPVMLWIIPAPVIAPPKAAAQKIRKTVLSIPFMPLVDTSGSSMALPVCTAVSPYQVMKRPRKVAAKPEEPPPMAAIVSGWASSAATPAISAASISVTTAGARL